MNIVVVEKLTDRRRLWTVVPLLLEEQDTVCDFLLAGIASARQCRMSLVAISAS